MDKFQMRVLDDMTDQFNWRSIATAMTQYDGTMEDVRRIMEQEDACWSFKQKIDNGGIMLTRKQAL